MAQREVDNPRQYGKASFDVAVIHGGPGAPGHMAPVARELSDHIGVLEPLQTADTIDGQVEELVATLEQFSFLQATLIGSSWGAILSYIVAARYPSLVKKLILVGSAVYEERYAEKILETRLERLSEQEKRKAKSLMDSLGDNPTISDKDGYLARLGRLFTKADAYNPITLDTEDLEVQYHIYERVWSEAVNLRRTGALLRLGSRIRCPVVAVHGDYDPNPPEGVREPLSWVVEDFRFVLLKNCGHLPWIESEAKEPFFKVLREELGLSG